jgi:orfb protein|nr:MAG TPA: hypothetical protein [Caudoviricetes sp.]
MIAKFQIILEGGHPLKIQCIDKFSDDKLETEKRLYRNRGYKEIHDNYFKNDKLNNLIIFENVKELKFSKYKHYCLKSAYERYIQGREGY